MYDELIKDLREWPRICVEYTGSLDELHDKAADAIEELSKELIELKLLTCCCGEPQKEE